MKEQFEASPQEATQAAISMALSNFNGIFALASTLVRHGLLDKQGVDFLHSSMLAPLTNSGASSELMALQAQRLDDLCAGIVHLLTEQGEK